VFECKRCCRFVENEESYFLYDEKYCRACMNTISNDPDYQWVRDNCLGGFRQIEN